MARGGTAGEGVVGASFHGSGSGSSCCPGCAPVRSREEATRPRAGWYQSQPGPSVYSRPDASVMPPAASLWAWNRPRSPSARFSAASAVKAGSVSTTPQTVQPSPWCSTGNSPEVSDSHSVCRQDGPYAASPERVSSSWASSSPGTEPPSDTGSGTRPAGPVDEETRDAGAGGAGGVREGAPGGGAVVADGRSVRGPVAAEAVAAGEPSPVRVVASPASGLTGTVAGDGTGSRGRTSRPRRRSTSFAVLPEAPG